MFSDFICIFWSRGSTFTFPLGKRELGGLLLLFTILLKLKVTCVNFGELHSTHAQAHKILYHIENGLQVLRVISQLFRSSCEWIYVCLAVCYHWNFHFYNVSFATWSYILAPVSCCSLHSFMLLISSSREEMVLQHMNQILDKKVWLPKAGYYCS